MEKYIEFFNEFATEDIEDILTVCEMAGPKICKIVKARFDDPKLLGSVFSKIFTAIQKNLRDLEDKYSSFEINVCDRLLIGYSNKTEEDDEKAGNFMFYMRHMSDSKKVEDEVDSSSSATELAVQWNTENIRVQPELLRKIAVDAIKELEEIKVMLSSSEFIFPIFVTVYENLINYLRVKRGEKDVFEYEINFMSCFYIGARESEDGVDDIYIRPNIESKLFLKNDLRASSEND